MVDGISTTGNTTSTSSSSSSSSSSTVMGKDDFLKMMIAQLKNQDPLNPMDGTEYASQLAQFTSLEQLTNLNTNVSNSMDTNYMLTQSINNTMAATLIGKDVKIDGGDFQATGQDTVNFGYTLPTSTYSASIKIYNENGALVRTLTDFPQEIGDNKLSLDLYDNNGNKLSNGKYTIKVEAVDVSGNSLSTSVYKQGAISGVRFSSSGAVLVVDGSEYSLSDVLEILNNNQGEG